MKIPKTITLRLKRLIVTGHADVSPWGGGRGYVKMREYVIDDLSDENIKAGMNDGGFGVESINGAVCDVYAEYSNGHAMARQYLTTRVVGDVCEDIYDEIFKQF